MWKILRYLDRYLDTYLGIQYERLDIHIIDSDSSASKSCIFYEKMDMERV